MRVVRTVLWSLNVKLTSSYIVAFQVLADLHYNADAQPDLENGCLQGTRVEVIDAIVRWAIGADEMPSSLSIPVPHPKDKSTSFPPCSDESSRVLWICGLAGTGKSSIWRSVAARLDQMDRLGAYYAFSASHATANPSNLFSTIARQLADKDPLRKERLVDIIKNDTVLRKTKLCTKQFKSFIVEPSIHLPTIGETLILIDAFDECSSLSDPTRAEALDMLTKEAHKLPAGLRVIVTSRPEPDVWTAIKKNPVGVQALWMDDIPEDLTTQDIGVYVKDMFRDMLTLSPEGLEEKLDTLIQRAKLSFQWAATACKYIKDRPRGTDPTPRLDKMLSTGANLEALYRTILDEHFGPDTESINKLRLVLGHIMAAQEPLSFDTLTALVPMPLSSNERQLQREVVQQLGSLLSGVTSDVAVISPLHPSFRDFIRSTNSAPYTMDAGVSHARMALGCLAVMKAELRFNIAHFPSSFIRNREVTDLKECEQRHISLRLSYGCRFWAYHASETVVWPTELVCEVTDFFRVRFLWWLEVMSLTETSAQDALAAFGISVSGPAGLSPIVLAYVANCR